MKLSAMPYPHHLDTSPDIGSLKHHQRTAELHEILLTNQSLKAVGTRKDQPQATQLTCFNQATTHTNQNLHSKVAHHLLFHSTALYGSAALLKSYTSSIRHGLSSGS